MAIKQRALMKLDMTKKHVLHVMSTRNKAALGEVYRDLTEARDMYREGLPRSGYAAYGEIYDGLILAVRKIMEGGEANFQEEVLALCQELLEHLERETAKETRFKKEIFFLPYKASMFDSLESVWRAADEDKEHCNAYVMPIPYADRNPDQTVAAWHCERDQFPKDVPTLDWQQVDLKVWHPDIVVYHSPYDDGNAVTSVDEQYYSRNLRYCADKLVYIPYFVLDEIEPGDEGAEEGIAHFILAPGVLNADLIVVQSEKMRQVYINVLSRYTNQGEEYWQAHVSGAGSPKIEKVLTSKKEDFEMPEKWRQLVKGKKVILYNTSITAMLQCSDKVCDKLRYVFDVFRNRDDVVLWWRPHPLLKATFHSMRPQFEEEYLGLEKQYIEEGWGIYDDSSDLHRAICWSDAYYGDLSSVVWLYRATNKPLMIEDMATTHFDSCNQLAFISGLVIEGIHAYFLESLRGLLCKYNLIEKRIEKFAKVPNAYLKAPGNYGLIFKINHKYIILPTNGDDILEYDSDSKEFSKVFKVCNTYQSVCKGNFDQYFRYKSFVLFTGNMTSEFVKYNINSGKYSHVNKWYEGIRNYVDPFPKDDRGYCLFGWGVQHDAIILLPFRHANIVLELNIETDDYAIHFVGQKQNRYIGITFDGVWHWLLQIQRDSLIKWNYQTKEVHEACTYLRALKDSPKEYPYNIILLKSGKIFLFPVAPPCKKKFTVIDTTDEKIALHEPAKEFINYYQWLDVREFLYTSICYGSYKLYYRNESKNITHECIIQAEEFERIFLLRMFYGWNMLFENWYSIKNLFWDIKENYSTPKKCVCSGCGDAIWRLVTGK